MKAKQALEELEVMIKGGHGDMDLCVHIEHSEDDYGEASTVYNPKQVESLFIRDGHIQVVVI